MPFMGSIKSGVPYTIDITPETTNSNSTALTFGSITRRDRLREDSLTVPNTQAATRTDTLSTNVVRLAISIYPPPFGVAQFRLTQGTNVITYDVNGDTVRVFDVGP